jgi:hypothetical protein
MDRETGKLIDPQPEWKTPNGAEHELKWTPKENGQRIMRETPIGTDGEYIFMLSHINDDNGTFKTLTLEQYEVDFEKYTIERIQETELLNNHGDKLDPNE